MSDMSIMLLIRLVSIFLSFLNLYLVKLNFHDGSLVMYQTCLSVIIFFSVFSLFGAESYIVNRFDSDKKNELFECLPSTLKSSLLICFVLSFIAIQLLYNELILSLVISVFGCLILVTIVEASFSKARREFYVFQCLRSIPMQLTLCVGILFSIYGVFDISVVVIVFIAAGCVCAFLVANFCYNPRSLYHYLKLYNSNWSLADLVKHERLGYFVITTFASVLMLFDVIVCGMLFSDSDDYIVASRFSQVLMVLFVIINNYYSAIFRHHYIEQEYAVLIKKFVESFVFSIVLGSAAVCVLWLFSQYVATSYFQVGEDFSEIFILLLIAYAVNLFLAVPMTFLLMIDQVSKAVYVTVISALFLVVYIFFVDINSVFDLAKTVIVIFGFYKLLAFVVVCNEMRRIRTTL